MDDRTSPLQIQPSDAQEYYRNTNVFVWRNRFHRIRLIRCHRYQNVTGIFCRASTGASKKASGRKPQGPAMRLLGTVSSRIL
jgi:hypothetical protein